MKLSGRYILKRNEASIICFPTENDQEYDSQNQVFSQSMHISLLRAERQDIPFITNIIQICKEYEYLSFAIMDESISDDVLSQVLQLAKNCFSGAYPQIIISVKVATRISLPNDVFIGAFYMAANTTYPQSFNATTLRYSLFKALLPEATRLSITIRKMGLGKLESIIWIDNWFQQNIQYIQGRESSAIDGVYICPEIARKATVPDVLLNHYGTCEDIAVSIAVLLSIINIDYHIIQANEHAWLLVNLEDKYYVWDCTRNITRNRCRMENALKALAYSSEYTLIGYSKFSNDYLMNSEVWPKVSTEDYPREKITETVAKLSASHQVRFLYDAKPVYGSFKKL